MAVSVEENPKTNDDCYQTESDSFRKRRDFLFGINSYLDEKNNIWIRDATKSIPLNDRASQDYPRVYRYDMLLRCISRLRPVRYAIEEALKTEIDSNYKALKETVSSIIANDNLSDDEKRTRLDSEETNFNTFLIKQLYEAGLTEGCYTKHDARELLFHYRNLSSVLTPARPMVTITYDEVAKVLHRETQYPVTTKTEEQTLELNKLKEVIAYPTEDEMNSHHVRSLAHQKADALFADLIAMDDRILPAQTRKSHLATAKNAFIVKYELISTESVEDPMSQPVVNQETDVLWLARMASPAYVGKGESVEHINEHTRENFNQVRSFAKTVMDKASEPSLHVTTLNTYAPHESQLEIIDSVYAATRNHEVSKDNVSYHPVNLYGTSCFFRLDIAKNVHKPQNPGGFLQKATRAQSAASVILSAVKPDVLSVVHCASGQDRTGTIFELSLIDWAKKWYNGLPTANIKNSRVQGGNAAEITSHLVPGSSGMKECSIANDTFGTHSFTPDEERELYRDAADTNKKPKVGDVRFLKESREDLKSCCSSQMLQFSTELGQREKNDLTKRAHKVLQQIQAIYAHDTSARTSDELMIVMQVVQKSLKDSQSADETQANAKKLAEIAKHTFGHASPKWRNLGVLLAVFACALLVAVGLLGAIPTGGMSVLIIAAAGGALLAGMATAVHHREKGLAKSVSEFKEELCPKHQPTP